MGERFIRFFMQTKVIILLALLLVASLIAIRAKYLFFSQPTVVPPQPTIVVSPPAKDTFDISGSYTCRYASMSAVLSKKRLFLEDKTATGSSYILFNGDCLYTWQRANETERPGQKTCGLGKYVAIAEVVTGTGVVRLDTVVDSLTNNQLLSSVLPASHAGLLKAQNAGTAQKLIDSCRPVQHVDQRVFELPKSLQFREAKPEK